MTRLYDIIGCWAEGQNTLNACATERREGLESAAALIVAILRRHPSLADLAAAYYDHEAVCRRVAEEFALNTDEASAVRDAAYWQRFMEIRHRRPAPSPPG